MASTRRRSSTGFDTPLENIHEESQVLVEAGDVIEEDIIEEPPSEPAVVESLQIAAPTPPITVVTAQPNFPKPKRHPRNIPKFSRIK
jgi:hypothetical protein